MRALALLPLPNDPPRRHSLYEGARRRRAICPFPRRCASPSTICASNSNRGRWRHRPANPIHRGALQHAVGPFSANCARFSAERPLGPRRRTRLPRRRLAMCAARDEGGCPTLRCPHIAFRQQRGEEGWGAHNCGKRRRGAVRCFWDEQPTRRWKSPAATAATPPRDFDCGRRHGSRGTPHGGLRSAVFRIYPRGGGGDAAATAPVGARPPHRPHPSQGPAAPAPV